MELYKKIRSKREELGMSQEELALKLGYKSRSTIAKIEKGENDITQSKIAAFAQALQTTPGDLMGLEDTNTSPQPSLPPPLTEKDERNIQKKLTAIIDGLAPDSGIAFYDDEQPMSEEDKELLRISLENSLRLARQMAKQKFTPKKYRKE